MSIDALPEDIQRDIETAKTIILDAGAKEIFLFGSLASGSYSADSDIDLAVIGLDKSKFFHVYGELISRLQRSIDIIGLDYESSFSEQLKRTGTLFKVA